MKFINACQNQQAWESAVKCLFQEYKKMPPVGFESRPRRLQSRRSNHSTTMPTYFGLLVFFDLQLNL